ncbi:centrosome-associated protein 350-like [Callorhinchus milii]|uniref:centrosome-associated protein 350-like n=1 Tax=Callorhinchus milii TaxID=7868 RepID=UPI001C3F7988|nr:centrosome-associated protein 350-like [Callorhinchus milii]
MVDAGSMESEWDIANEVDVYSNLGQSIQWCKGSALGADGSDLAFDDLYATNKWEILQDRKPSPEPSFTALSLSPPGSPFAQRLELLRSKSPARKLEKLRELIRKQRQQQKECRGSGLQPEQPIQAPNQTDQQMAGSFKTASAKKLIRKVTHGPPAPAYQGFNVMEMKKGSLVSEDTEGKFTEKTWTGRRELIRRRDLGIRIAERGASLPKNTERNKNKVTPKDSRACSSPSPKRTARGPGPHPFGVAAWREGQRLVRRLLGPPPKLPKPQDRSLGQTESNDTDSEDQPMKRDVPSSVTVEHKRLVTFEKGSRSSLKGSSPDQFGAGVERDLRVECERVNGDVEGLRLAEGMGMGQGWFGRSEERGQSLRTVGSVSPVRSTRRSFHGELGENVPRSGSDRRRRSVSPDRSRSPSAFGNDPRKGRESGEGTRARRTRSYDAEGARAYMSRRQAERKKKEMDERRSVKRAVDTKKRRLQEVYKKQREALSKREKPPEASPTTRGNPHTAREESTRKDLELQHLSPVGMSGQWSVSVGLVAPLTGSEISLNVAPEPCQGRRSKQERLEALRGMAASLSGRVESEAERLGVDAQVLKSPGHRDRSERWRGNYLDPFVSIVPTAGDYSKQNYPSDTDPATAAIVHSMGTRFSPKSFQKCTDPQGDDVNEGEAEVCDLMDELLCSSTTDNEDVFWSDFEPLVGQEPQRDSRETEGDFLTERKQAEYPNKPADVERSFDTGEGRGTRRGHGRNEQEMSSGQDVNRWSPMGPNTQRLCSPESPSPTRPRSPSRHLSAKQTGKGKHSDVVGTRHCPVTEEGGQCLAHSALNAKPLDGSRLLHCTRDLTATDGTKGKWDPLTRRLSELMKQLKEETEQLSGRYSSLTDDCSQELLRSSTMNPLGRSTGDLKRNIQSPGSEENSVDGKGWISAVANISASDGLTHKSKSVEQSFRSLLPSESHWRRTVGSGSRVQFGDNSRWNTESLQKPLAFGSQDAFSRFTLEMAQQYVKEEELRARHQAALFRLREKALREKTAAELAWLEHQKTHLRNKGDDDKIPTIINKQRGILIKLQQEKMEIRNLQSISRVAHQERTLLLRQQEEIFRIRQSTAQLQCKLDVSVKCNRILQVSKRSGGSASPESSPRLSDTQDWSSRQVSTSETGTAIVDRLKKTRSHLDEKFLTREEKDLLRHRQLAEELLEWKQRLDVEERAVHRIETEAVTAWKVKAGEKELNTEETLTEKYLQQSESKEPLGPEEVLLPAADVLLGERDRELWNTACAAGIADQIPSTLLEPDKTLGLQTGAEEMQSHKRSPVTERSGKSGGAHVLSLKEELANRKAMMGKMRREQRMREREKLKVEEAKLCKELKAYDAFILEARAELISDTYLNNVPDEVKTPFTSQDKPRLHFPSPERSNVLDHSAQKVLISSTDEIQTQELPLMEDDKNNGIGKIFITQDRAVSVDNLSPDTSTIDEKLSSQPPSELPPPSESVNGIHRAEGQLETFTFYESQKSSLCSNADIVALDPVRTCEELPQDAKASNSKGFRNNGQKTNGSYGAMPEKASIQLEVEHSGIISPTKEMGLLLGNRQTLHQNIVSVFVTSTTSNHDSKTYKAPVDSVTNNQIDLQGGTIPQGHAEDLAQTTIVKYRTN